MARVIRILIAFLLFPSVSLAGTSSICAGGGCDYLTCSAWVAAIDDATLTEDEVGQISGTITDACNITGVTQDGNTIILEAASGAEATGLPGAGAKITSDNAFTTLRGSFDGPVIIRNLEIETSRTGGGGSDGSGIWIDACTDDITIEGNLIHHSSGSFGGSLPYGIRDLATDSGCTYHIGNNIIYDVQIGMRLDRRDGQTYYVYNNTLVDSQSTGIQDVTTNGTTHVATLRNNMMTGSTTADYSQIGTSGTTTTSNNLCSDSSTPCAHKSKTITYRASGSNDFRLATDCTETDAIGQGTNVYSDANYPVTTDIEADSLTERNDIGADECVAASTGADERRRKVVVIQQ